MFHSKSNPTVAINAPLWEVCGASRWEEDFSCTPMKEELPKMALSAGQMFGKYQILERIATGGMAEVIKAQTEGIGGFKKTYAIKRVLPHLSQNKEYIAMLVDEAKVAGLLSHANIVQILDLGQIDQIWFIAMEYVDGSDLGRVLKRIKSKGLSLPVPHAAFICIELLKGLEYAHKRQVMRDGRAMALNIVHRDISPPNILLSLQGEVKLTDFGIASASHKALETEVGIVKGRFEYMSPEQAQGVKDLDMRSDIFATGIVLYQMLAGAHPFRTETELGTLDRIRLGNYSPLQEINPEVPVELCTIVHRALENEREERYGSAQVLREALETFFHESGFLFNHGNLSTYVKGLFPEKVSGVKDPMKGAVATEKEEKDDIILGDPSGGKSENVVTPEDPTMIQSNPFLDNFPDPSQWEEDLDTVVGHMPATPAPMLRTKAPPKLKAPSEDEQETLIRPSAAPATKTPLPVQPRAAEPKKPPAPLGKAAPKKSSASKPTKKKPFASKSAESATPKARPKKSASGTPKAASKRKDSDAVAGRGSVFWPVMSMVLFLLGCFLGSAVTAFGVSMLPMMLNVGP
jgi:serine/threonine-protein kinase